MTASHIRNFLIRGLRIIGFCFLTFATAPTAFAVVTTDTTWSSPQSIGDYLFIDDASNPKLTLNTGAVLSDVWGVYAGNNYSGQLLINPATELFTSGTGYLGVQPGAHGAATVTGAGSQWYNDSSLYVGVLGTGVLNVQNGGKVINAGSGYVSFLQGSIGTATVSGAGSQWNTGQTLFVGGSGTGTLNVQDGGKVTADWGVIVWASGTLAGDGGTVVSHVTNFGILAADDSPGTLTLQATLYNRGSLEFALASLASFDQLSVGGAVDLGGTIDIRLIDGFHPSLGDSFHILSFPSLTNSGFVFDFTNAALDSGLAWNTSNFTSTGTISITAVPEPTGSSLALAGVCTFISLVRKTRRRKTAARGPQPIQ
jgi:T5SS/PEP-CTERM-associated repeat protein